MSYNFINISGVKFSINARELFKTFMALPIGNSHVKIISVYDSSSVLMPKTAVSDLQIDGNSYTNALDFVNDIHDILFSATVTAFYTDSQIEANRVAIEAFNNSKANLNHNHNDAYYLKAEVDNLIKNIVSSNELVSSAEVDGDAINFRKQDNSIAFSLDAKKLTDQGVTVLFENGILSLINKYGEVLSTTPVTAKEAYYDVFRYLEGVQANLSSVISEFNYGILKTVDDTYYFVSKNTNKEDFTGNKIYINDLELFINIDAPDITNNDFNAWAIDLPENDLLDNEFYTFNFWNRKKPLEYAPFFNNLTYRDNVNNGLANFGGVSATEKEYFLIRTQNGLLYFVTNAVNNEDFTNTIIDVNGLSERLELGVQVLNIGSDVFPTDLKAWAVTANTEDLVNLDTYDFSFWRSGGNVGSIVVENYEDIPFKEGVYVLSGGISGFASNYLTNITNLVTGARVLLKDVIDADFPYVKRSIVQNEAFNQDRTYFIDEVYNYSGVLICTIGDVFNDRLIEVSLDFFNSNYKDNFRLIGVKGLFYNLTFTNEIYTNNNAVKSQIAYNTIDFNAQNLTITINGEDATGAVKIGLLNGDDNYIAFDPNEVWTKDRLQGANVVLSYQIGDGISSRIATVSRDNFTGINAASAENQPFHGGKMQEVFASAYGNFTANFVNGIPNDPDNVGFTNLTNNRYIQDTLINANADIIFGATGTGFISSLFLNYPQGVFKVFPNGANSVVRDDNGFDNDTQFLTNGALVTSRDDDDLDGSDPTGTSYGFGVEFNEPTRTSDLQAQGYDWISSIDEHSQSKATAIVAGKLKYIKDQTGAPWYLVREAARQTASHANSYNIYTGFGVIDKAAAITWLSTKTWDTSFNLRSDNFFEDVSLFDFENWRIPTANSNPVADSFTDIAGYAPIRFTKELNKITISGSIRRQYTAGYQKETLVFTAPERIRPKLNLKVPFASTTKGTGLANFFSNGDFFFTQDVDGLEEMTFNFSYYL